MLYIGSIPATSRRRLHACLHTCPFTCLCMSIRRHGDLSFLQLSPAELVSQPSDISVSSSDSAAAHAEVMPCSTSALYRHHRLLGIDPWYVLEPSGQRAFPTIRGTCLMYLPACRCTCPYACPYTCLYTSRLPTSSAYSAAAAMPITADHALHFNHHWCTL